jgi:hypothetical protein
MIGILLITPSHLARPNLKHNKIDNNNGMTNKNETNMKETIHTRELYPEHELHVA